MSKSNSSKDPKYTAPANISPVVTSRLQSRLPQGTVSRLQPYYLTHPWRTDEDAESQSSSSSSQLPEEVQAKMESSFGTDFSEVEVHKNSASAQELNAKAYAKGNEIHFSPGEYNPESKDGQELIGHELTHVVQQGQGKVGLGEIHGKGIEVNQNADLEKEADEAGKLSVKGCTINLSKSTDLSIQKKGDTAVKENPIEKGGYLIHSKYLSIELHKRIHDKEHPLSPQEIKDTLTRWREEKKFETKENEKSATALYSYEKGSSIVECLNPEGPLTITGYMEDENGQKYQNIIYSEEISTVPMMDFSDKERKHPGYTFSKKDEVWHNWEGNSSSEVSPRQGALIMAGTVLVVMSGGGLLLADSAIALFLAGAGVVTAVDDVAGMAMTDQKDKPWYDQDSAVEQMIIKLELGDGVLITYKSAKIALGLASFKQFLKGLSKSTDTPTKLFEAVSAFVDGLNTGKDATFLTNDVLKNDTKKQSKF